MSASNAKLYGRPFTLNIGGWGTDYERRTNKSKDN